MYFNNADSAVHESASHLGFTHVVGEAIVVATHQCLSPSHPVFRLLAPHFLYLIAINNRAIGQLVSPGGYVDKTMVIGRTGMFEIIKRTWCNWRLDRGVQLRFCIRLAMGKFWRVKSAHCFHLSCISL
eukprot:XP_798592.3 PREDICTED: arachidonate 12-lipoxygenase, 12S-type-like [Strongylocentrotus purpuratus]